MDIRELRIGNLVLYGSVVTLVETIGKGGINFNNYPEGYSDIDEDWIQPIPITEEWLLKFGFEKRGPVDALYNDHWRHPNLNPVFSEETFTALTIDDGIDIAYDIKYVHQIQNVFFVLTGQELTIKELV